MIAFAREPFGPKLYVEMYPLLVKHWHDVAKYHDIVLAPDVEMYVAQQQQNTLRIYTIRQEDTLKGYAAFMVRSALHYKQSLQAAQDVIFVDQSLRGTTPLKFIRFCDDMLRAEGVQVVYQHVKVAPGLNFGKILERHGYELVEHIYAKRLDKER